VTKLAEFTRCYAITVQEMKDKHTIFIYVDTEPATEMEMLKKILAIKEVKEVHVISGQYDLLVVVELDLHGTAVFTSVQELAHQVIQKIRKIDCVRDTNTIVPFISLTKRVE